MVDAHLSKLRDTPTARFYRCTKYSSLKTYTYIYIQVNGLSGCYRVFSSVGRCFLRFFATTGWTWGILFVGINAFTTGNPLWGTKSLVISIGRGFRTLMGLINQAFSRVMTRPAGRVGSGGFYNLMGRVGSGHPDPARPAISYPIREQPGSNSVRPSHEC